MGWNLGWLYTYSFYSDLLSATYEHEDTRMISMNEILLANGWWFTASIFIYDAANMENTKLRFNSGLLISTSLSQPACRAGMTFCKTLSTLRCVD